MERDFEREFKELKLNEIPDLWGRIEAGLSEKRPAAGVSPSIALSAGKYKARKRIVWRKWGTLAAACLCVAIILPALSFVIGNLGGRKNSYSDSAPSNVGGNAYSDADGSVSYAPADNFSGAMDMTEASEMLLDEESAAESADNSKMTNASENLEKSEAAASADAAASNGAAQTLPEEAKHMNDMQSGEAASGTDRGDYAAENSMEDGIAADYALSGELEDGQILRAIAVEVSESASSVEGVVYKAVVKQADEDGFLTAGGEISIVCDSDTKYDFIRSSKEKQVLKAGESYEVSLRYEQDNKNGAASQGGGLAEKGRFVVVTVNKY